MICSSCGTENEPGRKYCAECGARLALACSSCGNANSPGAKFCGECGGALASSQVPAATAAAASPRTAADGAPASERRLVSVLFADLVGFTTLSESRDPEEVRELLSGYFDTCRKLIARYGGTVEKFIGDAVMAVWGTPVATEDDAERAVRAALELTAAVAALGAEVGAPDLAARAGVLTGEAAVTIGAEGQGMVAGDLVNTASRVQSIASPGAVYVGEITRRATEETIVYEDAGSHELKGKAGLVPLWRALRVVAGARGTLRSYRSGGPLRGAGSRAPPGEGALPRLGGGPYGPPRLGGRHRRDREVPPGLGVLQVLRRPRRYHLVASGPMPVLRRGRHLLGPGRDGEDAGSHRRGRGAVLGPRQAQGHGRGAPPRSRGTPVGGAPSGPPGRTGGARRSGP